ncbi:SDR family NAD(P)-dependent oxidoreductase [Halopelagius longus]|uniref:NAD(P)-dependent dehydrogenase, short-chain alcohol dehydrogenase family n=1 Tax=Halopelagius longus TaxID=1236180 RepID=A0A1H1FFD3_9EURY|nr:SDR family oxidoreductase [Halopelagius longus]RDI70129.1 SDR family oxidoreductase [Halopelagius longus]SDQ99587.1 NAD(P)-dependent dehydrogenase, short-chain alcohol dehydrogenase family [Halopelagius longus]
MGRIRPDFGDETVIVTGGASGIGREVSMRFGDAGATVIVADLDDEPKDADVPTHEAIRDSGGTAEFVETDVTDREQLRSLVEAAREFGGVDVMVNNAGLIINGSILELDPEEFDAVHAVNAKGVYFGTQVAANDMLDREDPGVILNTASISSNTAQFEQVQYDSSKGAVRMITRGAALELAEHGIRVNAVAPGQIATEFTEGWSEEAREKAQSGDLIKPVPFGRAGTPEDVAGAYLYLASDDADYVTGELLHVDGGWQIF